MKYLGVLSDETSQSSKQSDQTNIHILKTVYYSLFGTHLPYACQLWSQNNRDTQNQISTLQNRPLKNSI